MTARRHMDGLGGFVRDGGFVLRAAVVGLRGRVQGFAFIAPRPAAGRLHHTRHLGVYDIVRDSAAHVAVADEEDVGVEGLEHCSRDVSQGLCGVMSGGFGANTWHHLEMIRVPQPGNNMR